MIKLSDRLQLIAKEVNNGETVADIGTDHGFLPIYLWEQGISPKVIMADVSQGSLNKAQQNCNELYPDNTFDLRLGNGIQVLKEGEVDVVTIAGMGGILMTEILGYDLCKTKSFRKIVLQPRNNPGFLRHWLRNNGFCIINEQLVREGKFICEIITAIPKEIAIPMNNGPDSIEYQFPHNLIDFKGPLTIEYLSRNLQSEKKILDAMNSGKKTTFDDIRRQEYRIYYLERMIKSCENR